MASILAAHVVEHCTMPSKLRPHLHIAAVVVRDGKKKKMHLVQADPRVCQDMDEAMRRSGWPRAPLRPGVVYLFLLHIRQAHSASASASFVSLIKEDRRKIKGVYF